MNASVGAGNLAGIKLHTGDFGRNIGRDNEVSMRSRSEGGNAERRMTACAIAKALSVGMRAPSLTFDLGDAAHWDRRWRELVGLFV